MTNKTVLKIGANTLSIYVIHFIILYGSFTGLGLYRFFHHELNPATAIIGAIFFMVLCTYLALSYSKNEVIVKQQITDSFNNLKIEFIGLQKELFPRMKFYLSQIWLQILKFLKLIKN